MKKIITCFSVILLFYSAADAQTNIISTNPLAEEIMLGNYNPTAYLASNLLNHPDSLIPGINTDVSPDSLKRYIEKLGAFYNRNTGSDTVSMTTGIGAARRWVYAKFEEISSGNENRLISSYLQFDQSICGATQHRNIFAVLPGMDTTDKSMIIIEGHMDSRCSVLCDTSCRAEGIEDNATGTALVLELARVMSKYSYNHTIVFLVTIGEEQGLSGAEAFADYVQLKTIKVKGVFNNDVIGGVVCGQTSSPPSCPGLNIIDSTQVRLFSQGGYNSFHKGLARFVKLQYKEELLPLVNVPMTVSIMSAEDRTGRGGDHIPFRQHGYSAIRFTSANEHGDASNGTGYTDRQHTSDDVLGVDTDSDMVIDSFFVDFNYLARNSVINGIAAGMIGIGPKSPEFQLSSAGGNKLRIEITQQTQYLHYRVGVRTVTNDWDSVYTFTGTLIDTITADAAANIYYVSVASVDANGIESLFSREYSIANNTGIKEGQSKNSGIELLQNKPNPFDESTIISVLVNDRQAYKKAYLSIFDLTGKEVFRINIQLANGMNEILYDHGYNMSGTYIYTLIVDGKAVQSKRMVFTN